MPAGAARLVTHVLVALPFPVILGCASLREMFPSRDEVFKPIPVNLGESFVREGDTLYRVTEASYTLIAGDRDLLPDAKKALDAAARDYHRFFGANPAPIQVELRRVPPDRDAARRDSTFRAAAAADTGPRRVLVTLPELRGRDREMMPAVPAFLIARRAAAAWLSTLADARHGQARTVTPGDDPRIPDWIETGLVELLGPVTFQDTYVETTHGDPERLPLAALFEAARPPRRLSPESGERAARVSRSGAPGAFADEMLAPPRRGDTADRYNRFVAEAYSAAQFLIDREGSRFLGRATERLIAGDAMTHVLREAAVLPKDLEGLERVWKEWLQRQIR